MLEIHNMHFILALRVWILHEDRVLGSDRLNLVDIARGDPRKARAFDALAAAYRHLALMVGVDPSPDHLLRLGPIGIFIHAVTCQVAGTWVAFRRGVTRRHCDLPSSVPLTADELTLASYNELVVFRSVQKLPGVTVAAIHPDLGATAYKADLNLTAITGQSVLIEAAMLLDDPASENRCQREYRCRLATKLLVYARLDLDLPVIIGYDDLAPRRLAAKMREILDRLALPVPPLQPAGWLEDECYERSQRQLLALLASVEEAE